MVRLGRNDPCYCGSGKKYKNCCLENPKSNAAELIEYFNRWQKTQKAQRALEMYIDGLSDNLQDLMIETYEDNPLIEDLDAFDDDNLSPEWANYHDAQITNIMKLFIYSVLADDDKESLTTKEAFIDFCEDFGLGEEQIDYLFQIAETEGSFYRLISVDPDNISSDFEDIFTGEKVTVIDRGICNSASVGTIIYGRAVPYKPEKGLFVLEVPTASGISTGNEEWISGCIDYFRKFNKPRLPKKTSPKEVLAHVTASPVWLTTAYAMQSAHRKVVNRDGDELSFITAIYGFSDRAAVLDFFTDHAEFEIDENKNGDDEITWLNQSKTVLAWGTIKDGLFELETNSKIRFKDFEKIAKKSKLLKLRDVQEKSITQMMKEKKGSPKPPPSSSIDLEANPEIKEKVREYIIDQMSNWPHEEIPALGNKKPVDLVKTPEGRAKVAGMVDQMERDYASKPPDDPLCGLSLDFIRDELGL